MILLTLLLIRTSTTTIHVSTITASILAEWDAVTLGDDLVEREQRYKDLDYSVKFLLNLDNYADQQLTVSQSIIHAGEIEDDAKDIGPGLREAMSGHKSACTSSGIHGCASWKIGDTGKMVVVMYFFTKNECAKTLFCCGNVPMSLILMSQLCTINLDLCIISKFFKLKICSWKYSMNVRIP